jgi:hypothetical protein
VFSSVGRSGATVSLPDDADLASDIIISAAAATPTAMTALARASVGFGSNTGAFGIFIG